MAYLEKCLLFSKQRLIDGNACKRSAGYFPPTVFPTKPVCSNALKAATG